jgi:hypothetical protein
MTPNAPQSPLPEHEFYRITAAVCIGTLIVLMSIFSASYLIW